MIKTIDFRGPMRPAISVTTRKDGDKNQIITNINYDQNSLSIFLKQLITKPKWHQKKPIVVTTNKIVLHKKYGTFPQCDLITS